MSRLRRVSPLLCMLLLGCTQSLDLGSDRADAGVPADASTCTTTDFACVAECSALQSSLAHCGRCDNPCGVGREICLFGACSPCLLGLNCDNVCVHAYTDPLHCGSCTTRCAAGQICMSGKCQ